MPILIVAAIIAGAWFAKTTAEEIPFAVRGKWSPRRHKQYDKHKARMENGGYRFGRFLADLWDHHWKEALQVRMHTSEPRVQAKVQKALRRHEDRMARRHQRWGIRDARKNPTVVDPEPTAPEQAGPSGPLEQPRRPEPVPVDEIPKPEPSDRPTLAPSPAGGTAPSTAPKETPMPNVTGETLTLEQLQISLKAFVGEAVAELEDAQANARRAADDLGVVEQMVASLGSVHVPEQVIGKIRALMEPVQLLRTAASQRLGAAETLATTAQSALDGLRPQMAVAEAGAAAGGIADGTFYGQRAS